MDTQSGTEASLCRLNHQTCGACCWGVKVNRATLKKKLSRQRSLFHSVVASKITSKWKLFRHEVLSHRGANLVWALLLVIPFVKQRLKKWLAANLVCPFLAFDSDKQVSVGCMLHPSRHNGVDVRNQDAFRLLSGIACGDANYACNGCLQYNKFNESQQEAFQSMVSELDWFDYTNTIRAYSSSCTSNPTQNEDSS